ncbi:MAG: MATE family efflux transporter [Candidatus Brocadiia bacterium]
MQPPGGETREAERRSRSDWITEGSIPRALWRITLPTWGAFITHDLLGIVDMFFVGKLGKVAVAAVAMSGIIMGIIIMLGQGVTAGTTALVANALGRDDEEAARESAGQSLVMAGFLSLLVIAGGVPLAGPILRLLGASPDVVAEGIPYLRIFAISSFALMGMMSLSATLRGAGDAVTPFKAMVLGNAVNIILDPILIFGWLGVPALGVAGSAWATLIGRSTGLVVVLYIFFVAQDGPFRLHVRDLRPHLARVWRILRIGIFASGRMLVRNIAGLLLMRLVAGFGTAPVAAYGISMRVRMLVFGPSMGFGTAAATLIGQNLGAEQPERAEKAGWIAAGIAICISLAIMCVFWTVPARIIAIFNDDPQVVSVGVGVLRWLSASFAFMTMAFVLGRGMTGAGDTLSPMLVQAFALLLVGLPLAYALSHALDSVKGIWMAIFAANVLAGLGSAAIFRWGRWKEVGAGIAERDEAPASNAAPVAE